MEASCFPLPESLAPLPPSAKLVFVTLDTYGPQRSGELVERTALPRRTVHDGLDQLKDINAVEPRPCLEDRRATEYLATLDSA